MPFSDAIPESELILARLTAAKLAKVMHGLMSVGTGSLELDSPADFLAGRQQTPLGFLAVLGCIAVKPGHADKITTLRERVTELSELTTAVHAEFMALAGWRSMSAQDIQTTVDRLGDRYAQFCQRLGAFCALLGEEADYASQAELARSHLNAFFRTIAAPSSAG